jgi:F0F1-type ATP synthase membrane subunit b/b'
MDIVMYYMGDIAWDVVVLHVVQCVVFGTALWRIVYLPYMRIVQKRQRDVAASVAKVARAEAIIRDARVKRSEILAGKR